MTCLRKHTEKAEVQLPDVRQTAYKSFISACQYTRGGVRAEIASVRLLQEQQLWLCRSEFDSLVLTLISNI